MIHDAREGGTRLAAAVKGPGIKLSGITFELMHGADLMPTLVTAALGGGAKDWHSLIEPTEPPYELGDGMNLWGFLSGAEPTSPRKEAIIECHPEPDTEQVSRTKAAAAYRCG